MAPATAAAAADAGQPPPPPQQQQQQQVHTATAGAQIGSLRPGRRLDSPEPLQKRRAWQRWLRWAL